MFDPTPFIQQALDHFAATQGASHVGLSINTSGATFYSVSIHNGNMVRSGNGDTLSAAMQEAINDTPFNASRKD